MKAVRIIVLSLAWVALASSARAQPSGFGAIQGRVVDEDTRVGLPEARVELLPLGRLTLTSADGRWEFGGLEPGTYMVRVTAEGFEPTTLAVAVLNSGSTHDLALTRRPYRLHESVTVTAERNEARTFEMPRSITVIDSASLDQRLPRTTPEALGDAPGVFVQKTNHGSGSPYLRGLVGNQVLVMVDGIRLNNATFRYGPNQYLATVDPANIDRIEVVRGSGSVLHGSDAMGGVVNIITRRPAGVGQPFAVRGGATTKVMSNGMEKSGRFNLAVTGEKLGVVGGLSLRRFGDLRAGGGLGIQAPSGYDEVAGDLRAEWLLTPRQRVTLAYQHNYQSDVPRFDQVAQRGFARYSFDPQVRQLGYARYERTSPNRWWATVRATASLHRTKEQREYQPRTAQVLTIEHDRVLTGGVSIELQSRPRPSLSLVSGLDYYHDAVESARRDRDQTTGQSRDRRGQYASGATAASLAAFTHATVTGRRWRADAGVRLSHFGVSVPDPDFGSAGIAPTTATGSAGVSLALTDGLRLFGSVAQAFRAPNIDDLSSLGQFDFGVEVPAPALQPESSVTVEGGAKWRTDAGSASVSVYRTSLDQLIDRVRSTFDGSPMVGNQPVYQKANVGSAFIRGVEADGAFGLTSSLTASGSLMYTYGQATSRNEPMRRIPPLNGLVAIRAGLTGGSWLEGALRFAATQDRLASGDIADHRIPPGGTPGWTVFTISAGHRLGQRLEFVGSAQNLFNTAYRTHGSGIDGYGRSLWVGLHAAFW
ncbi:MAG: TonB-dependent receptor [Acidobacteriota bacterium]|nr:TonB-dependent receptor [Acidobacteriota bacterium]